MLLHMNDQCTTQCCAIFCVSFWPCSSKKWFSVVQSLNFVCFVKRNNTAIVRYHCIIYCCYPMQHHVSQVQRGIQHKHRNIWCHHSACGTICRPTADLYVSHSLQQLYGNTKQ